jgi:alkylhydroperoxidase family enzyme
VVRRRPEDEAAGLSPGDPDRGGTRTVQLTIHTVAEVPAESRPVLESIASDLGRVPNLAASVATSPALLTGFDGLRRAVASTSLAPTLREVAGLTVGVAVDNRYGVAWHSTALAGLGVDEAEIERLRRGEAPVDATCAAVHAFAREVVMERGKVSEPALASVAQAGLSTETILEVVLECTFAGLVGVIDNLAGHVTLDAFLAPRAWTPA